MAESPFPTPILLCPCCVDAPTPQVFQAHAFTACTWQQKEPRHLDLEEIKISGVFFEGSKHAHSMNIIPATYFQAASFLKPRADR